MSSEHLASAQTELKGDLGASWNILDGASANYTDLGVARRFGGAAAAYSLRDIGAMNDSVVRVRREPQDTDATINDEENFSANQVQSGALEDWVNGELESTLPVDVDPTNAAAAYSLRKVKSSYNLPAVRIRRETDDVEVNVAFDSDNKVSSSSSITNTTEEGGEIGSTSETTLGSFLSETTNVEKSYDHSQDPTSAQKVYVTVGRFGSSNPVLYDGNTNSDSLPTIPSGSRYASKWTATNAAYGFKVGDAYNGATYDIEFDILQKTGTENVRFANTNFMELYPHANIIEGSLTSQEFTTKDSWVHFKMRLRTGRGNNGSFLIRSSDTSVQTTWYIANLTMTPTVDSSAYVHTWYDQAGSNNAVQDTAQNQPLIANDGALLADGLDFDGTDDYLEADGVSSIYTGTDEAHSSFVVVNSDVASTTQYILGIGSSTSSNPIRNTLFHSGGNLGWQVRDDAATLVSDLSANPYVANQTYLVSALNSGTTIDFNTNSVINDNGTAADVGASTINTVHIGTRANSPTGYLNGSIQELVFYGSDQSANRFKIESNINNYYGLYNDENEADGVWIAASGSLTGVDTITGYDGTGSAERLSFRATSTGGSKTCGLILNKALASGDDLFVSFNLKINSGTPSITIRSSSTTTAEIVAEDFVQLVEGFNAYQFNIDTAASAPFLAVQDSEAFDVQLKDLKVSRIARNGFVETWYDQSGSGNNATQGTADKQPSIVQNGGICTSNSSPSVLFTGDTRDDKLEFTDLTLTDATILTVVDIDSSADQQIILGGGGVSTSTGAMLPIMDNGSSTTQVYKNSTVGGAEQGSSQFKNGAQITLADRDDAFDNLAVDSQILFTMVDVDVAEAKVLNGISRPPADALGFHMQGQMNELIIYNSDLSSDRGTIESEIANHYNITLS